MLTLEDQVTAQFQQRLLAWFAEHSRTFPWRSRSNPYIVLVAEKLLQQTAARDSVVRAFDEVVRLYPTPHELAIADISELKRIIKPLGFTYRANELQAMAQALVDRHAGVIPRNLKELLALPGVGDYAARAVLSFAWEEDIPIVDTNVARFLYRIYAIEGKLPSNPARKRSLIRLAACLVPPHHSKAYNLAVLDLCALVCKPSKPDCINCPVRPHCRYGSHGEALTPGQCVSD